MAFSAPPSTPSTTPCKNPDSQIYYAHGRRTEDKSTWQRLCDHLRNTARLAFELGKDANVSDLARLAGLLHDIGKYSQLFQCRLDGLAGIVDHATAGAREVISMFPSGPEKLFGNMLAYVIAGHHTGLPDYGSVTDVGGEGTLLSRLNPAKTEIADYSAYKQEIDPTEAMPVSPRRIKPIRGYEAFSVSFLIRMIFSVLVDADWLDTETFFNRGNLPRGGHDSISDLCARFNAFIKRFDQPETEIDRMRTATLKACLNKAALPQGIFTMTIPTGGGKTIASMGFALNHAVSYGLKRIIYVIPFTGIIEQNASVFAGILGDENVLEHHSNYDWEKTRCNQDGQEDSTIQKLKLAAENWDIPIIVTTNVQFFESLFANKKSRCRKLHNIARSVIIFDEAQMLPRDLLRPSMLAVRELVQNYGVTAVFCTATQPILREKFMADMPPFTELADDPQALFDFYRRVEAKFAGALTDAQLLERMNGLHQALCIVNTRRHAKGLFAGLDRNGRYHLSTLMCPAHRKETLQAIRARLEAGEPCRVVSTQVMEAGIDVDFPEGFRALAGGDSIAQAAGRVNREMKRPTARLTVFEPRTPHIKYIPAYLQQTADVSRIILRDFAEDPFSVDAMKAYFRLLITLADDAAFDAKNVLPCLNRASGFDFATAAERFKVIDNDMVSVIIPYNDHARKLIEELRSTPFPAAVLRKLQSYTVNIYEQEFMALDELHAIERIADTYPVLCDMRYYDAETGIMLLDRD